MKFHSAAVASTLLAFSSTSTQAFLPASRTSHVSSQSLRSAVMEPATATDSKIESLTADLVSKLRFREVQKQLELRELDTSGTFSEMRNRLREATGEIAQKTMPVETQTIDKDALNEAFASKGISFEDNSDPDFEYKELVRETLERAEKSHWKGATRKLRRLSRRFGKLAPEAGSIDEEVYTAVLQSCIEDRLHGARAAESARRIMELMVEEGYEIPNDVANYCIRNSMGKGPEGTHDGFGGIDTALAMMAAVEHSAGSITIQEDTYSKLVTSMAASGSIDDSLRYLRTMVAEKSQTPGLQVFAEVTMACALSDDKADAEKVMTALAYAKAAGYELDSIASTVDGRTVLAAAVIAAEKIGNVGLGLRFLTAASKAKGCEPDRGDDLVATSSPAAQRACTILHRLAIFKACEDGSWQLAVKLLELMLERGLTPSPAVWRSVVNCLSKNKKSRKATSVLLDWVQLYNQNRAEKPPLRIFNTVVNACEVCGEEDLTIRVLDSMKETHDTEGNLVTFNIALKRLAKQGNTMACEGIIIGMLQNEIEPSVVSYTTAIAACVAEPKNSAMAVEWTKRMRSRLVQPNVITYNTALASCLDGTAEGAIRASGLAMEMIADVQKQVDSGILEMDEYTNIMPDFTTRTLAKDLLEQLDATSDAPDSAKAPLQAIVEFLDTDLAEFAEKQKAFVKMTSVEDDSADIEDEEELEYSAAISTHRAAAV